MRTGDSFYLRWLGKYYKFKRHQYIVYDTDPTIIYTITLYVKVQASCE